LNTDYLFLAASGSLQVWKHMSFFKRKLEKKAKKYIFAS